MNHQKLSMMPILEKMSIGVLLLFCVAAVSCKGGGQKAKEKIIAQTISNMKEEANAKESMMGEIHQGVEKSEIKLPPPDSSRSRKADDIIGVWEVKNSYYSAIYEIEKYEDTYIGKIHYYNDGQTEYTGTNQKSDYFLEGVSFKGGVYKNGKMYMPDGTYYYVIFKLDGDELTAIMSLEEQPYKEVWKRKKYERN